MSSISAGTTTTTGYVVTSDTTGALVLKTGASGTTAVTIDTSQNVGVGTASPSYKLDVNGTIAVPNLYDNGGSVRFKFSGANAASRDWRIVNDIANYGDFGIQQSTTQGGSTFDTKLMFSSTGNIGLGVTPSAWRTAGGEKVFQFDNGSVYCNSGNDVYLNNNWYLNSSAQNIYIESDYATSYGQVAGQHIWYQAASGTAGGTVSFTQAMTLDASGNLCVGTTSAYSVLNVGGASGAKIFYTGGPDSNSSGVLVLGDGARSSNYVGLYRGETLTTGTLACLTIGAYQHIAFCCSGTTLGSQTERARITSDGNLLVGTTSNNGRLSVKGATADSSANAFAVTSSSDSQMFLVRNDGSLRSSSTYYITTASAANLNIDTNGYIYRSTSSLKYKNSVQDATHGLAEVLALRPVTYKGNNNGDTVFGGLIAEEVHEAGLTEFVQYAEDGSPDALAYGNMVSLAFKAIQEQQAIITQLTERITALEAK